MQTVAPFTPLQYIMGRTTFLGLEFIVNVDVLIPRPETEVLAKEAVKVLGDRCLFFKKRYLSPRILDLGTGSACIAISLIKNVADCKMIASDISKEALKTAKNNARLHGVFKSIDFIESDLFQNIAGKFDIIISNPPYIARYEFPGLQREVLMEPRLALDGGEDGLDFYRRIIAESPKHLEKSGYLLMEIGWGQLPAIKEIIAQSKKLKLTDVVKDQNGIDRVVGIAQ